ncbi:hypothetical protein QJS83_14450 [Bdellovibrio sp. 22V]|uniref:hypothetical protein n=1 Tax=Bdellovibrio TaxID=958 RepID=UPI0025435622|nr:hypothetical protein [Bdellovibrio sp. 22V]WII71666.1 hypothetical protein QJS83_14450 [Bdellovibrio sp. 22V]
MNFLVLLFVLLTSNSAFAGEVIDHVFTSGGYTYKATIMDSFPYPFVTVTSDKVLLITHNSTYWDREQITWRGTAKLAAFFRQQNFSLFYLADIQDRAHIAKENYLPVPIAANEVYPFQGDTHRIIMQGRHVVIAGGNFTVCACQTTRSVIALAQTQDLNVHLAMDAIYEGVGGQTLTLKEISDKLNDEQFLQYLKQDYFNPDFLPCPEALLTTNRTFKYRIYRHDKFLGEVGNGTTSVHLYFADSEAVVQRLASY